MRVLAQHEYEGVSVTQFHYFFELDGEHYEGTNISAMKNVYWNNEWMLEFIGEGGWQYDKFRGFVPDRDRIYLLHGGAVSAREVATGKEIWSLELYGAPFEGVVDSNGNLYVYCVGSPFITAITPDGEIIWQHYHVEDYRGAWSMEIIDDEIMILTEDDYDKCHIFFDFDGNYRVEKVESPEF